MGYGPYSWAEQDEFGEGQIVQARRVRAPEIAWRLVGEEPPGEARNGGGGIADHRDGAVQQQVAAERARAADEVLGVTAVDQLHEAERNLAQPPAPEDEWQRSCIGVANDGEAAGPDVRADEFVLGQRPVARPIGEGPCADTPPAWREKRDGRELTVGVAAGAR